MKFTTWPKVEGLTGDVNFVLVLALATTWVRVGREIENVFLSLSGGVARNRARWPDWLDPVNIPMAPVMANR